MTIHTSYELWRDKRESFDQYQSVQSVNSDSPIKLRKGNYATIY